MEKRSSLMGAALACLCGVLLSAGCATTGQADWKVLQQTSYGNKFSYDVGSVTRTPVNTLTVLAKADGAKYLYEIDCKNRKARILEGVGSSAAVWFEIAPGSGEELLSHELCR